MISSGTDIPWKGRLDALKSEVHLYSCNIVDLDVTSYCQWATDEERLKANRFRKEEDALRFLMGRAIAKFVLAKYLDLSISNISILPGDNKKPIASCTEKNIDFPHFNISHSGNRVVVAFANEPIGVDIEEVKDIGVADLAETVFSDNELNLFKESKHSLFTFYKLWTGKEALLKALGLGLVDDLKEIDISKGVDVAFVSKHSPLKLKLESFEIEKDYLCSVCYTEEKQAVLFELPAEAVNGL
ncbi:4'-phosphopantetheinyl transferase family protein [Niabella ginsengisoli]|uniref:4'-phosphopantetheinyl transferase superfamily protein n=1 Tax=Niabella ginsengisoli TaxID=522298 RepID=A0ABS9SHC6_9BACT|nr:4'-phosphopantetheinyl transferase superfamily protein [Niabella ginsengisoli]MCH5597740.1 4'-phosphopantetheinyl transferase superfamily protein [Niabella ginsengisoli]